MSNPTCPYDENKLEQIYGNEPDKVYIWSCKKCNYLRVLTGDAVDVEVQKQ